MDSVCCSIAVRTYPTWVRPCVLECPVNYSRLIYMYRAYLYCVPIRTRIFDSPSLFTSLCSNPQR